MKYNRWKRIIFAVFCCVLCLTQFAPLNAKAEDLTKNSRLQLGSVTDYQVDLNTTGSIQIHDRYGKGVSYYLYLIAEFSEDGSAYYTDALSAYAEELDELPDDLSSAANSEAMAEGLKKIISDHKIAATVGPVAVDSNGYAFFSKLKPGYYLVFTSASERSDGKVYAASPIFVSVPKGTDPKVDSVKYDIRIEAKSELKDKPKTPDKPHKPNEPGKPGGKLPQTGVLWWPLPFLFAGGLVLYFLGVFIEKKAQDKNKNK